MAYRDWGSKTGGGGVASKDHEALARKQRLRELAMDTVDLKNDPYFMRNHLGTYECKLCLTLHANEGNYLAHTQGRRHQSNLKRRAARESHNEAARPRAPLPHSARRKFDHRLKIGTPGYQITKQKDPDTAQLSLLFQLSYPQIAHGFQPRHRFMSAFEQKKQRPDPRYQYLLFAAEPYETVAFKIPNMPIDKTEGRFFTHWDREHNTFTLQFFFDKPQTPAKATPALPQSDSGKGAQEHNQTSKPNDPFAGIDHPM